MSTQTTEQELNSYRLPFRKVGHQMPELLSGEEISEEFFKKQVTSIRTPKFLIKFSHKNLVFHNEFPNVIQVEKKEESFFMLYYSDTTKNIIQGYVNQFREYQENVAKTKKDAKPILYPIVQFVSTSGEPKSVDLFYRNDQVSKETIDERSLVSHLRIFVTSISNVENLYKEEIFDKDKENSLILAVTSEMEEQIYSYGLEICRQLFSSVFLKQYDIGYWFAVGPNFKEVASFMPEIARFRNCSTPYGLLYLQEQVTTVDDWCANHLMNIFKNPSVIDFIQDIYESDLTKTEKEKMVNEFKETQKKVLAHVGMTGISNYLNHLRKNYPDSKLSRRLQDSLPGIEVWEKLSWAILPVSKVVNLQNGKEKNGMICTLLNKPNSKCSPIIFNQTTLENSFFVHSKTKKSTSYETAMKKVIPDQCFGLLGWLVTYRFY